MSGAYVSAAWEAFGTWLGGTGAAAAGSGAAEGGAAAAAGGAAAGGAAAGAGAGAAAGGTAAAGAGAAAAGGGVTLTGVAAATTAASALYQLSQGGRGINVPPSPQAAGTDESVQNAEQMQLKRAQAAGGLQSTTGTPGGQAGAMLNPTTLSQKSLLGG